MLDPGHMVESVTLEEDPHVLLPIISVETSDDGTTRRTETTVSLQSNLTDNILSSMTTCLWKDNDGASSYQVKKVTKTTTTRTVIPSVSDTLSLDGTGSVTGIPGCNTPMDRVYRPPGGPMDYPTATVPRNYHYGPPGYDDFRSYPPSEAYTSLSRGTRMDDRYRSVPVAFAL